MKMKEVCQKTGLTERSVRYYIERGLIQPAATPSAVGRRMDYQFDSGHILELRDIAALRECGFSIERILNMKRNPSAIPGQIEEQMKETESQEKVVCKRREILCRILQTPAADTAALRKTSAGRAGLYPSPIRRQSLIFAVWTKWRARGTGQRGTIPLRGRSAGRPKSVAGC